MSRERISGGLRVLRSGRRRPKNCVWEITRACNLRCLHCGSRAGRVRPGELTTRECLDVAGQLADLGCELCTISGGEPTQRQDWDEIGRALVDRGVVTNMITNGVFKAQGAATEVARRATEAGLCNLGVSIDGDEAIHDRIRGKGTFARSMASVRAFAAFGMNTTILTTVNRWNLRMLEDIRRLAIDAGASAWRLQLAKPMGAMDDQRELIIAPEDLLSLMPRLARLQKAGGIPIGIGDSLGYYGAPDRVLRNVGWRGRKETWQGCQAGLLSVGIEADGGVKGCLSMQAHIGGRDPFLEGNLRQRSLEAIWEGRDAFAYNREFDPDSLTGPCRGCDKGAVCRGGARCVSSAVCGKLTEDPFCYYRVAREAEPAHAVPTMSAVAVALALTIGGCGGRSGLSTPAADAALAPDAGEEPCCGLDYGVEPMPSDAGVTVDAGEEPCCGLEYGVEPMPFDAGVTVDAGTDAGEEPCCTLDYGVIPPPPADAGTDAGEEPCCTLDYGIEPPADLDAGTDAGAEPCCGNDYGIEPPPVDPDAGP